MKIYTQFIILSEKFDMPDEETFCPFMWVEPFDAEGDYYWHHPKEQWTELKLAKWEKGEEIKSRFYLNVYKSFGENIYPNDSMEEHFLYLRYIEIQKNGCYKYEPKIHAIKEAYVTKMTFQTMEIEHYKEFLLTVYEFLKYTKGFIMNSMYEDADKFYEEFIINTEV